VLPFYYGRSAYHQSLFAHIQTHHYYFMCVCVCVCGKVWPLAYGKHYILVYDFLIYLTTTSQDFKTFTIFDLSSLKPAVEIIHARRHIIFIILYCYVCNSKNELQCFSASNRNEFSAFERKIKSFLCTLRSGCARLHLYRLWFIYFMSAKTDIHNIQRCALTSGDWKWIPIRGDYLRPDRFWWQRIFQTEKTFTRGAVYIRTIIFIYINREIIL